jgi:hypothetical protein
MKLWKAWNSDVWDKKDVLVFWSEDQEAAYHYIREQELKSTKEYIFDLTLNELFEELEEYKEKALNLIGVSDFDNLARLVWDKVYLKQWTLEELEHKGKGVFVCYPDHISELDDVEIVFLGNVLDEETNYKNVIRELGKRESKRLNFIDYVNDRAVNCSFNESMFCDSKGYIFKPEMPFSLREDIFASLNYDEKRIGKFLDEFWLNNVNSFFIGQPKHKAAFINYITSDIEPNFTDGFYFYVAEKLLSEKDWVEYEIKEIKMPKVY